jgi:deoxyribodipyrimidine photolyase
MGLDICVEKRVDILSFRAGSYSGFMTFRKELAKMVSNSSVEDYFAGKCEELPFAELIDHSDCDGELNYDECLELKRDFDQYEEQANKHEDEFFRTRYSKWKQAVDLVVADNKEETVIVFV